ncbi:hypothetical protein RMATCC62417_18199 [Rhizopus microsporus]|nr:hypothetical protein RMATCC62417_18199 [Rhizopus microsporus]
MNANKKLKAVHQASQVMTTFQLAQEPKAVAASSEVGHCTAAAQATVTGTPNASVAFTANKEGTYGNACPVLFVQESHPLGKFKELAMRLKIKPIAECHVD